VWLLVDDRAAGSATRSAQKSRTNRSVSPVSATSSAIRTRAPPRSTVLGTGGNITGIGSRSSAPV
jgi:hypothetical protein